MEALMLAALLLFEIAFLPEAIPGAPCFRNLYTFRDALFQLPTSPNTITGDFFLTTYETLTAVRYPAVWFASLACAVPTGCALFPSLFDDYAHMRPSDVVISISNLFPVVYGELYHFNPERQGLLYLPMLAGSLLAECGTGQAGDRCVAADLSSPLGMLIGRHNADYAARKKGGDAEGPASVTAIRRMEGNVQSDSSKVPEMRLVVALVGTLICIVRCLPGDFPSDTY